MSAQKPSPASRLILLARATSRSFSSLALPPPLLPPLAGTLIGLSARNGQELAGEGGEEAEGIGGRGVGSGRHVRCTSK